VLNDDLSLWGHGHPASFVQSHSSSFRLTIIILRCLALLAAVAAVWGAWAVLSNFPSYVDVGIAVVLALAWAYKFEREA
jgi:hypothetical protein